MKGEDVLALRQRLGWTQTEMATKLGVTVRTVRNWERKGAPPFAARMLPLLEAIA